MARKTHGRTSASGLLPFGFYHTSKNNGFFVHYKVVSRKFRGKFLDFLQQALDKGELSFKGDISGSNAKKSFTTFKNKLYKMEWVVNIQKPFGNPKKVLEYLSRYVFRIAITNRRIIEVKNGKVLFSWKNNRTNCPQCHAGRMRFAGIVPKIEMVPT